MTQKAALRSYNQGAARRVGRRKFITVDTEQMAADANQELTAEGVLLSRGAHRFGSISLPPELARKILLLEISALLASPPDPALQKELAGIETSLEADYGRGNWCAYVFQ